MTLEELEETVLRQGWHINDLEHQITQLEWKEWENNVLHNTAKRNWYEHNIEDIRAATGKTTAVYYCGDGCPACEQEYRRAMGIHLLRGNKVGCCGQDGLHWRECG